MVNYVKMTVLFQLINCKDYFLYNLQSNCRKDEGECSEFSKKKKKKKKKKLNVDIAAHITKILP